MLLYHTTAAEIDSVDSFLILSFIGKTIEHAVSADHKWGKIHSKNDFRQIPLTLALNTKYLEYPNVNLDLV